MTHVHAPVPVMPWSHTPPRPHAQATQFGPYSFTSHCVHVVPLAYVPLEHADTQVALAACRSSGDVQVRQVAAVPAQVAQLLLQVAQAPEAAST